MTALSVHAVTSYDTELVLLKHISWTVAPLIPAWISNHMPSKVWDEITYPFLNFNGATVEV